MGNELKASEEKSPKKKKSKKIRNLKKPLIAGGMMAAFAIAGIIGGIFIFKFQQKVLIIDMDWYLNSLDPLYNPDDAAYFHAQFRRINPLPYKDVYTILDGVKGWGHYVGTYMCWGSNNSGWWGEGEIKFYMDGDKDFPTICGTGTEDYFCGSYGFTIDNKYREFTTPHAGMPQALSPDGLWNSQQRFGLYRWHIMDPVRFEKDLKVTIQALGWRSGGRYLPLQDDISSVAFWYQKEPHASFPKLPGKDYLEVT